MFSPLLLFASLTSCSTPSAPAPCDTVRIDVGIMRARIPRGLRQGPEGAAYMVVPHRGGYLLVLRVVGDSASILYPAAPSHQMTIWGQDTLRIIDSAFTALRSGEITLLILWSASPFALPQFTDRGAWNGGSLTETWSAILARNRKVKTRMSELDAALAGAGDAVVVVRLMENQLTAQQMMADWRPGSIYPSGGLSDYQAAHPSAPAPGQCSGTAYAPVGSSGGGTGC